MASRAETKIERAKVVDAFYEKIGNLDSPTLPLTDLDNEVHPLFAQANISWQGGHGAEF
jgi:hypothetical protein